MKIHALGPIGTFSYIAARYFQKLDDEIIEVINSLLK